MPSEFIEYKYYFYTGFIILIPLLSWAVILQNKRYKVLLKNVKNRINKQAQRQEEIEESIRIICLATIQQQCETSEASIRLSHLIPGCNKVDTHSQNIRPIFELYSEIRTLKVKEKRRALSLQDRMNEDKARYIAQEKYHDTFIESCEYIHALLSAKEQA